MSEIPKELHVVESRLGVIFLYDVTGINKVAEVFDKDLADEIAKRWNMHIRASDDEFRMMDGKHKGKLLKDVPAKYLLWYWENGGYGEGSNVHDYISRNWKRLITECPGYTITHQPDPKKKLPKFQK